MEGKGGGRGGRGRKGKGGGEGGHPQGLVDTPHVPNPGKYPEIADFHEVQQQLLYTGGVYIRWMCIALTVLFFSPENCHEMPLKTDARSEI